MNCKRSDKICSAGQGSFQTQEELCRSVKVKDERKLMLFQSRVSLVHVAKRCVAQKHFARNKVHVVHDKQTHTGTELVIYIEDWPTTQERAVKDKTRMWPILRASNSTQPLARQRQVRDCQGRSILEERQGKGHQTGQKGLWLSDQERLRQEGPLTDGQLDGSSLPSAETDGRASRFHSLRDQLVGR
eukprot:4319177-Amphidinium_carterae.1